MADLIKVNFISFKKIYPSFLYPGGGLQNDDTFPEINHPNILIRERLKWYNPFSWFWEGLMTKGDLLHAQWWSLPLAPIYVVISILYKIKKKPVIFTVHNISPHEPSRLHDSICRLLFKLGTFFIVHSFSNRHKLIKHFSVYPERIALIPHGPLNFHVPKRADPSAARKILGIQPEHKVVLLFGAIRPYKGIVTAIESFSKVIKSIPKARLLIAGRLWEDWYPYEQLISKLKIENYIFSHRDYVPSNQVYRYFMASDLVILPYHDFDSQSGAGALAVAFQKPLIVTDVGGLPELQDNKYFVVPPRDPETLTQRIITCLQDPQQLEAMKRNSAVVADRISWSSIAKKTMKVYQKALMLNERKQSSRGLF